jgi:hypothetical protein
MKAKIKVFLAALFAFLGMALTAITASADTGVTLDLAPIFTTGINSLINNIMGLVTVAVPIVLTFIGVMVALRWGIRFFRGIGSSAR